MKYCYKWKKNQLEGNKFVAFTSNYFLKATEILFCLKLDAFDETPTDGLASIVEPKYCDRLNLWD